MQARIRESTHRLQTSPQAQRTRDVRVKLFRKKPRTDELSPTVQARIRIEMRSGDEALAAMGLLQGSRDAVDKALRTRMRPRFVQDAKCHERDSCHEGFLKLSR